MVLLAKTINPFYGSVWSRHEVSILQQLLERGADTAARDRVLNRTSLEWAVSYGHINQVWLFLERESFTALRKNAIIYLTKLYKAIFFEGHKAVKQLLHGKETLELESISELLLIYIPADRGYQVVVLMFLQFGAAIEAKTAYGESALHLVAGKGHLEIVELLLHHGADINSKTASGDTPLVYAARGGSIGAVELLLAHGAHIDDLLGDPNKRTTATTQALYGRSTQIVNMLLERGADVNFRDAEAHGGTLLHIVARKQHMRSQARKIKLLLKYGANLEARDYHGETPLRAAVRNGTSEAVRVFLERGADLEARNNEGDTPLVMAVRLGKIRMVQYLLEKGADPRALPHGVTIENGNVCDYDFERAVEIVLEAQWKTR